MIFIQTNKITIDREEVFFVHLLPFHETHGMGKTEEELLVIGYLVDSVPEMPALKRDEAAELFYNPQTRGLHYEIKTVPRPLLVEEEVSIIKDSQKTPDQRYRELDLLTATLQEVQTAKLAQLDQKCNEAIVSGFDFTIGTTSYRFSASVSAQANFQGTDTLFKDGLIVDASWTVVNNTTGKIERVTINQATFNSLKLELFMHINSNISKFRDTLQPQVESALTNAEVNAINWV